MEKFDGKSWYLRLLGSPKLLRGQMQGTQQADTEHKRAQGIVEKLKRKKSLALISYLHLSNREFSRDHLSALLWPDQEETKARTNLRSVLADLTKTLGEQWAIQDREQIRLSPSFALTSDVDSLTEYISKNHAQELTTIELDDWQAPFMEGFYLPECDIFEEWLYIQRQTLRQTYFDCLSSALSEATKNNDKSPTINLAKRLIAFEPLHEPPYEIIMRHYAQKGSQDQALRYFKSLAQLLDKELGIKPNHRLYELKEQIEKGHVDVFSNGKEEAQQISLNLSDVHYAKNGDIHVAYKQLSDQGPPLVIVWGFVSHLDQLTESDCLVDFFSRLAEYYSVILFDKRGMGLSDRLSEPGSLEDMSDDIICILDSLQLSKASLLGISEGGPTAIACAYRHPERIAQLLLYGTGAKWVQSEDYPHAIPEPFYDKWLAFLENNWGKANNLEHFAPSRVGDDDMVRWWSKCIRMSASPGSVRSVLDHDRYIDVRNLLPHINQPTLILQKEKDKMMRVENGRYLAEHIKGSTYVELPGEDHWIWASYPEAFFEAIETFAADSA